MGLTAIQSHAFAGEGRDAGARQCDRWLKRTLDAVESSPMLRRRDVVVSATARSCGGGFGITSPDDLMKTALEEAADETAKYLEKHR